MISPELLRRYPFFAGISEAHLREIAMITEEETFDEGVVFLKEEEPATALYFLIEGSVDLFFTVGEEYRPELHKELHVGEINPGEVFGISSMIEPHILTSSVRTTEPCRLLKIDAQGLKGLCDLDEDLCYTIMHQIAKAAMERLHATRVQLAAARAS